MGSRLLTSRYDNPDGIQENVVDPEVDLFGS